MIGTDALPFSPPSIVIVAIYLLGVNGAAFIAFWIDKGRARRGEWRISESQLLTLAAIGGTAGAIAGQRLLRHKSKKEPFRTQLNVIIALQVILLIATFAITAVGGWPKLLI